MLQAGFTQTKIAQTIGKHKSTISREIARNSDRRSGKYKCEQAQRKAEQRQHDKPHCRRLDDNAKSLINSLLCEEEWSPEQISHRLRLEGVDMVSHETIYQYIYADKRHKGLLFTHLRHKGRKYRHRKSEYAYRGIIPGRVDVDERPGIVDEKKRFGDLEIDTMIGKNKRGAILTINDRATSLTWIHKLDGKAAIPLAETVSKLLAPFKNLIHTITADNGREFTNHEDVERSLKINWYFCKPYHSWERGANENTNGLIRQYIPKKTDFGDVEQDFLSIIQNTLDNRPCKRLGWLSPIEMFNKLTNLDFVALAT